jgi:crotonobetainyl-CoA:carnitine CoA-transferase CaiB-like acyl-CoA transferase
MDALCGKMLRDLDMEVLKIEPPDDDPTRSEPPFANGHAHNEGSLRFTYLNTGKRNVTLNAAKPNGRKLLLAWSAGDAW